MTDILSSTSYIINIIFEIVLLMIIILKATLFIVGMFFTRKFKPAKNNHKYGICIAARNEEKVIGNLLDSINKQNYPKDLLTIFVVADNCTDKTAEISRNKGAIVYERIDNDHRTKGYALQYLFRQIDEHYKIDNFEGFFIFDADNLLKNNYISKMNNAFDEGSKIITSYRNTKNFDENWIASTYALHWIRSIRFHHRARSVLRLATNIQGTGFLFSNEIVKNGWKYTSLTEDRALTADAVAQGYQITYQDEAEFYDEQPVSLKIALRQRLRWSKGHLQAFAESGPYLFLNIFLGKLYIKTKWKKDYNSKELTLSKRIIESIRHRFASFDTLVQLTPVSFLYIVRWVIVGVIFCAYNSYNNGISNIDTFVEGAFLTKFVSNIFKIRTDVAPGLKALFVSILITFICRIIYRLGTYCTNMLSAIYVFIVEKNRIKKISFKKKVFYTIMWPTFDLIGIYTTCVALFKKVDWKVIPHESNITIDELNK